MADYRYLRAFAVVAKNLSFKNAAQELKISLSAVSRQISLLEASIGCELFIRSNKQLMLTPVGIKLASSVESFEGHLSALQGEAPLRIGCLQSVFEFFFVEVIKKHPKLFSSALDVEIGSPMELQQKAEAGQLDLLITNIDPKQSTLMSGFKLFQESIDWINAPIKEKDRVIVFSAFENHYTIEQRHAKNRIRINSFNGALSLTAHKLGNSLVAQPVKTKKRNSGSQWIFAAAPNYKNPPAQLRSILNVLKNWKL